MRPLFSVVPIAVAACLAGPPASMAGEWPGSELAVRLAKSVDLELATDLDQFATKGQSRFALAFEDQVRHFTGIQPESSVQVVGPVFTEYLHIFIRTPLQVHRPEDLSRFRIWAGEPHGPTRRLAELYLDHLGLPLTSFPQPPVDLGAEREVLADLSRPFGNGRIDLAFVAAVPGYSPLCEGVKKGTHALLPLDYDTLRALSAAPGRSTGGQRLIGVAEIPPNTYAGQEDGVRTVARSLLLLARKGESLKTANQTLASVREAWARFPQALRGESCRSDLDAVPAGLATAPNLVWLDGGPAGSVVSTLGKIALWALAVAALLWLLVRARRAGAGAELRHFWAQDRLPFLLLVALLLSIGAITIGTHLFEQDVNDKFATIPESFWSITVYLFSGLEDRTPYTRPGRVIAALGLLLGPAFFAVMSGWLARFFIRREKKMPQNLRNHYLLLNWNERAVTVVREIHHPILVANEGPSVIVLLTDREDLSLQQLKDAGSGRDEAFEDFYLSIGDPTSERGLLNANAQDARTIVIFAEEGKGDERTFRSIFALRRIARERGLTSLHVVTELLDPANTSILDEMARDFPGLLERVSNTELRTHLLAQAAMNPGIISFYSDLLQTTGDTNELYSLPVPDGAAGIPFCEYAACVLTACLSEPLVPVGIQRMVDGRTRMLTNPRPEDPASILRPGDRMLVFAYVPPTPGILPMPVQRTSEAMSA